MSHVSYLLWYLDFTLAISKGQIWRLERCLAKYSRLVVSNVRLPVLPHSFKDNCVPNFQYISERRFIIHFFSRIKIKCNNPKINAWNSTDDVLQDGRRANRRTASRRPAGICSESAAGRPAVRRRPPSPSGAAAGQVDSRRDPMDVIEIPERRADRPAGAVAARRMSRDKSRVDRAQREGWHDTTRSTAAPMHVWHYQRIRHRSRLHRRRRRRRHRHRSSEVLLTGRVVQRQKDLPSSSFFWYHILQLANSTRLRFQFEAVEIW